MLNWIKYLQRVRVETDALKRNKDLASTRTFLPRSGRGGRRFKSCHSDQIFSPAILMVVTLLARRPGNGARRPSC
jgi:hypothetical protein